MKWLIIFIILTTTLASTSYAALDVSRREIEKTTYGLLSSVLDAKISEIKDRYTIPIEKGNFSLNQIMLKRFAAMGKTGESYIVGKPVGRGRVCEMITQSLFESYKEKSKYTCTNHWASIFDQGDPTMGQWTDYRGEQVYGVGQRFNGRITEQGRKTYAMVVEKDVSEVIRELLAQQRILVINLAVLTGVFAAICFFGFVADRKRRRTAIENNLTLESVPSGIIRVDTKREIRSANAGILEMLGCDDANEIVGKQADMLFPEDELRRDIDSFNRVIKGEPQEGDTEIVLKGKKMDGTTFPVLITRHRVEFPEGVQILKVFVDLTAEVEARERIERKNEAMRRVGYMFRHDILNHITPAKTAIEYIKEVQKTGEEVSTEEIFELMDMAYDDLVNAIELNQSLSEWSRSIEADDGSLEMTEVDLKSVVEQASIEGLHVTIEGDLGTIECNPGLLQGNIVRNIFENAQKYSDRTPELTVSRDGNTINFTDNAGGFGCVDGVYDEEFASRLLKPRERGMHDVDGSGLGLANIKAAADAHDWKFTHKTDCKEGKTTWMIHV